MIALSLIVSGLAIVTSIASILVSRAAFRRTLPEQVSPGCSCGFAGSMGGRDPQCPEHGQHTDESPYASVSAATPPAEVSRDWPEHAPEVGLLHLYGVTHRLDYLGRHEVTVTNRHGRLAGMAAAAVSYPEAWDMLRSTVMPLLHKPSAGQAAIAEYARVREAWLGERNSTGDPVSTCITCGHVIVLRPSAFGWSHAGPSRPHNATPPYRLGVPEQPGPPLTCSDPDCTIHGGG